MRSTGPSIRPFSRLAAVLVLTLALSAILTACGRATDDPVATPEPEPATVEVEVFFTNDQLGDPCGEVFAVTRTVDADDPVRGALEALVAGPTADERAEGYGGWFSEATAELLLDVEVVDGVAHVTFADLRPVIPNASTSCGSAALLAELDQTLLAFDDVDDTRYALTDQTAFYEWLQLVDPDAPDPEEEPGSASQPTTDDDGPDGTEGPASEPAEETEAAAPDSDGEGPTPTDRGEIPSIDLTGWRVEDIEWSPVGGGCCGTQIIGTSSPPWPDEPFDWPDDGWYAASVERHPDDLTSVRLGLARWVPCTERPDLCVGEYPVEGHEDDGVAIDPDTSIERTVPIDELAVTISHVHRPFSIAGRESEETWGVHGAPGAFGTLLTDVLDPLYETWVVPLLDEDTPVERVVEQLVAGADDPGHPFGIFPLVDHSYDPEATFVAFRGPFGFPIELTEVIGRRENPARGSTSRTYLDYDLRTSGLYDLHAGELRMRDGRPILHLESGTPTWG